ncbi:MAG: DUF3078 domain-containing protein [Chlorobi bacterium]|nr:DUF3078 domain-containing protein [Chlorobiota bacterium]
MKATLFVLFTCVMVVAVHAQEKKKTPEYGWNNSLVIGVNLSQVNLQNWTQGGENSIAWTFLTNGLFDFTQKEYHWKSTLKLTHGRTKIADGAFEKTDDELFFESVYSKNVGWKVDPYAALQLRTQITPGYRISMDLQTNKELRTQTSGFFDPGYLVEGFGFTFTRSDAFSTRLGIAFKQTFSLRYGFADDSATPDKIETMRFQTGVEFGSSLKWKVMENILHTSKLNFFSAFETLDVWDVRWDNTITAKVNQYFNVSLNILLVHEIAQTRRTQLKQALAAGFSYTLM